jgi:hypothetical protein
VAQSFSTNNKIAVNDKVGVVRLDKVVEKFDKNGGPSAIIYIRFVRDYGCKFVREFPLICKMFGKSRLHEGERNQLSAVWCCINTWFMVKIFCLVQIGTKLLDKKFQ